MRFIIEGIYMTKRQLLITFICSFALLACSSKPTDADVKSIVTEIFAEAFPNQKCLQIKNIQRTNGFERQDGTYQIAAELDLNATKTFDIWNYTSACQPEGAIGIHTLLPIDCFKLKKGETWRVSDFLCKRS